MTLGRADQLYKAPAPTALKRGDWVRVANHSDEIGGQVWQYGVVSWVYEKQLVDINYDGGEKAEGIPTFEVQATRPR